MRSQVLQENHFGALQNKDTVNTLCSNGSVQVGLCVECVSSHLDVLDELLQKVLRLKKENKRFKTLPRLELDVKDKIKLLEI